MAAISARNTKNIFCKAIFWNFKRFFPGIWLFAWICLDKKLVYNANCPFLILIITFQITDPPEKKRQNAEVLVATLRKRLRNCEPYYTMKLMLVGKGGHGKTTLVHRLRDDFNFNENDLTQGMNYFNNSP